MGVHKRMKWNEYKGIEMNKMELNILNVFKQKKWMENKLMEWN